MFSHPFYFFWQNKSPFSNWYVRNFKVREMIFNCVEQYMMYQKAIFFGDMETAKLIMVESKPRKQKELGRQVKGFNRIEWDAVVEGILYTAIKAKFTQHRDLGELMLSIDAKEFVEASPYDRIYGVRLSMNDSRIQSKKLWLGLNILGRVLTRVRNWLYAKKKGNRMVDTNSNHPEVIILDLTDVFADAQRQMAHVADVNLLLPSMVSRVMTCVECRDPELTRLEVYASDLIEQFKNDGMPTEDGEIAAGIAKAIGRKLVYEIEKIGGYDENDNFEYDVYRVEISGAVVLTRLDPVGARAQEKIDDQAPVDVSGKETFQHLGPDYDGDDVVPKPDVFSKPIDLPDPDVVGKTIASGNWDGVAIMVDADGNPIKASGSDGVPATEHHPHQGYYQGHHNVQHASKLGEEITPEQQWENYEKQAQTVVIEENNPAAGFRSRIEQDIMSPEFNMMFAACDDFEGVSVRLNGQTIQNPTSEQLSEVADKLGFDAADIIMGQDKGYHEVSLAELKESPYKEILDNAFQDQKRVIINTTSRYMPLGTVDGDQRHQKWEDTLTGKILTNEERFNQSSED